MHLRKLRRLYISRSYRDLLNLDCMLRNAFLKVPRGLQSYTQQHCACRLWTEFDDDVDVKFAIFCFSFLHLGWLRDSNPLRSQTVDNAFFVDYFDAGDVRRLIFTAKM